MPAISPERMRDRYETILAAASRAFAEKGYETTSITEIARAAEVSDGLIYKYFTNKRDLLEHVLRAFYERIIEDLAAKVARGKRIRRAALHPDQRAFVDFRRRARSVPVVHLRSADRQRLSRLGDPAAQPALHLDPDRHGRCGGGERRNSAKDIDPRVVRDMLFGAIEHAAWRHTIGKRPIDVTAIARAMTDIFLNGLAPQMAKGRP